MIGEILFGLVYSQLSLCGEIVDVVSYPRSHVAGPPFWGQGVTFSLVLGLVVVFVVVGVLVLEVLRLWLEEAFLEFVGFRSFLYIVDF